LAAPAMRSAPNGRRHESPVPGEQEPLVYAKLPAGGGRGTLHLGRKGPRSLRVSRGLGVRVFRCLGFREY
jgi:hypothetical protein